MFPNDESFDPTQRGPCFYFDRTTRERRHSSARCLACCARAQKTIGGSQKLLWPSREPSIDTLTQGWQKRARKKTRERERKRESERISCFSVGVATPQVRAKLRRFAREHELDQLVVHPTTAMQLVDFAMPRSQHHQCARPKAYPRTDRAREAFLKKCVFLCAHAQRRAQQEALASLSLSLFSIDRFRERVRFCDARSLGVRKNRST